MRSSAVRGFTLIELIVAIGLASIVITALISFFTAFIGYQVRVQDERVALETVRFLFSEMAREAYFGRDYGCGKEVSSVCRCLVFTDQAGMRVKVWYDSTDKQVKRASKLFDTKPNTCGTADSWVPFTDASVSVTDLSFELETNPAKQPRMQANIEAEYEIDGSTKTVSFKTQITNRILEPSQVILETLVTGSDSQEHSAANYFAYGPRVNELGQYLDKTDTVVTDPTKAEIVCRDGQGNRYIDDFCEGKADIAAAELTNDGLYTLGTNGLLFFIPQASLDDAVQATGAVSGANPVYKTTTAIQNAIVRVIGKAGAGTCRFCANDPRGVVSIYPAGDYIYARTHNGALHKIDKAVSERILAGAAHRNTLRKFDADGGRIVTVFRDSTGKRVTRLFSGNTPLSSGDIIGGCSEFSYVPSGISGSRCRQIYPDPDTNNGTDVEPTEIGSVLFRFLKAAQVINNTVSLWYRDSTGDHLLSIGTSPSKYARTDSVASGGTFAYGNGLTKYTSVCNNGASLCIIDSITDSSVTTIPAGGTTVLTDHAHFKNLPIAISEGGNIVYFSGVSASDTATVFSVYNRTGTSTNTKRILCNAVVANNQQSVFKHISDKHPSKDIIALVGTSLTSGYSDEVYLAEPTSATKKQFSGTELNIVCGNTNHVERYHLPTASGPTGGLDLLRLHAVEFKDPKPTP